MARSDHDLEEMIGDGIRRSVAVREAILAELPTHRDVIRRLVDVFATDGKLLIFGNGGSAGDAQHIATELVGRFYFHRRALPALPLTVNTSALTAIGNDYEFKDIFSRQVEAYGRAGDAAIGMSTSGNAANVIEGVRMARRLGMLTIGMTGRDGGQLAAEADIAIRVHSNETPRIQEAHLLLGHLWCQGIEAVMFGESEPA
ncbi:MAG: SIS domain-containing protein [Chloroflexota bacterium]